MPVIVNSTVINAAVVIQKGKVLGVAAKTYLPNYKEFYEQRWFTSALQLTTNNVRLCGQVVPIGANLLFETSDTTFGIEICEDLWSTIPVSYTHLDVYKRQPTESRTSCRSLLCLLHGIR